MVEQAPYFRSYDPDLDPYSEDNSDPRLAPYPFERSTRNNFQPEPAPLFLSDYDGEPDPSEFAPNLRSNRKATVSFRILAGVLAASAAALLVTLFSSDVTRGLIVNAKASINAALQAQSASARPASAQLTARDMQLKDPARAPAPALPSAAACASSGNDGRHGADARGNHDGVSIRAAEPCAGRRRSWLPLCQRSPSRRSLRQRPLHRRSRLRQGRSTPTNSPHS